MDTESEMYFLKADDLGIIYNYLFLTAALNPLDTCQYINSLSSDS